MVNLELYRVFYTVAKCGSLTRAADELFISQPAVSQAIKQLEGQLGTPLFNRTHRGMELSEQGGKQIFGIVEKALAELDMAENKLKEINSTATGTIRISASDTIFSYVLIDKIAEILFASFDRIEEKKRIASRLLSRGIPPREAAEILEVDESFILSISNAN